MIKNITLLLLLTSTLLYGVTIEAKKSVNDLSKINPISREWIVAKVSKVTLYPKTSTEKKAKKVTLRALYNSKHIAFLIEYHDSNRSNTGGFSIKFATDIKAGEFPHINYKSPDSHSLHQMEHIRKNLRGIFIQPIVTDDINLSQDVIVASFSIYIDGEEFSSSWIGVSKGAKPDNPILASLNATVLGDLNNGKKLTDKYCSSCHNYQGNYHQIVYKGPDLSNVSGKNPPVFILESIVKPDKSIQPIYKKGSMPSFKDLPIEDLLDIVTFLQTQKIDTQ